MRPLALQPRHAFGVLLIIMVGSLTFFTGSAHAVPKQQPYSTGRFNAGTPYSSIVTKNKDGVVTVYGNGSLLYTLPAATLAATGDALYQQNCASCHGEAANGAPEANVPGTYPSLLNVGSAAVDMWIVSGAMPAKQPYSVQPNRKQEVLNSKQAIAIAAWIDSLSATPPLPYAITVNPKGANVSYGADLFALNCASCHTVTGGGDALAFGTFSAPLRNISPDVVAEAIRTGPGNMPRFSGNLSDQQVQDIVKYVTTYIEHPTNPGGLGLGGLGPVAEGFVGLALGVGLLCLAAFWVGDRQ